MFGIPAFLLSDGQRKMMRQRIEQENDRALAACVPWDKCKWDKLVGLDVPSFEASVVNPLVWQDVLPWENPEKDVGDAPEGRYVDFGVWRYCVKVLPARSRLSCLQGSRQGIVVTNAPLKIPGIWRRMYGQRTERSFERNPWMSLTPNEVWTLRPGVRAAKGRVAVAGLGLGWQLVQIMQKRSVTSVVLVEKDEQLVAEVLPRIRHLMGNKPLEVITGDARKLVPEMIADVAVTDIDDSYGGNTFPRCPNIGRVWVWGAASIADEW